MALALRSRRRPTPTVTGGYDFTYGYPPLAPLPTAPLLGLGHGALPATVVSTAALLAGTVVLWRMLPAPWRSAATMVCAGFGFLPSCTSAAARAPSSPRRTA